MEKAYLHLIKYALKQGHTICVNDGEEDIDCKGYNEAKEAIEAVDEANMFILSSDGKKQLAWAFIVLEFKQDPEETLCDYSANEYMDAWEKDYYKEGDS